MQVSSRKEYTERCRDKGGDSDTLRCAIILEMLLRVTSCQTWNAPSSKRQTLAS